MQLFSCISTRPRLSCNYMVAQSSATDHIERQRLLRAPRSRVWRALTDPVEFGRWFGVHIDGSFRAGHPVEMTLDLPSLAGQRFSLLIEEITPETTFAWSWHPGMPRPEVDYAREPMTRVQFTLAEAEGGTLVTVRETGFDRIPISRRAAVFGENTRGWEAQMQNLQSHVEPTV